MDPMLEQVLLSAERAESGASVTLHASDGHALAASVFWPEPERDRRRVLVINSATGVRRSFYARFARFFAARGYRVLTYDYRGIGGSRTGPVSRVRARMADWGERDFEAALGYAKDALGDARPLVVGHSVGGQIVGLAPSAARVSAMMLVGSQSGEWRHWDARGRARMLSYWYVLVPLVTATLGYLPARALGGGESLPGGVARQWARWGRRSGYLMGGGERERRAEAYAKVRAPILACSFEGDEYAPKRAVEALLGFYPGAARKESRHFEGNLGHFGFFRERGAAHWDLAADWLERAGADA